MPFFGNRRRDFSIQPPRQQVDGTPFFVTDSSNIDFTLENLNLTADLTFTGVAAGTYGDATNIPVLQIDQWGRVIGVTLQTISPSGIALEVNGTPNGNQTLLNLVAGTNMTITDDGLGNITFDATGGGGGTYTVNNGLTESPANNFQLGGATLGTGNLIRDTYITNDGYVLRIDQINPSTSALDLRHSGTGVNTGVGLISQAGGIAVRANSSESWAFEGISALDYTAALLRNTSSINDAVGLIKLIRNTSGTPFGGIGASIDFWIETRQTILEPLPTDPTVRLAGIWEVPGPAVLSRLSRFDMYGYSNGGTLLNASVRGDGAFYLYQYGVNTFAGTPTYALGVDASGNVVEFTAGGGGSGTVTSVAATVPNPTNPAFSVNVPNPTTTPSVDITANGIVSQYIRGDGSLANFPNSTGGGASVNYYLNGSINQGTFGGSTYYQMSKTPILGGGTNFIRTNGAGNGYIASFLTDAGDPSFLNIPGGNWNLELYFQSSASGGSPQFYGEIYKVSATNVFTLVASGSANPEGITNGTTIDQYFTSIPVPQTSLLITDRLAIRIYVITSGRTITLHTENGNLCEVLTTFTTGLTALNGLTDQVQNFAIPGTSGTAPNWNSVSPTHTLNIPLASTASVTAGLISNTDFNVFTAKLSTTLADTQIFVGNASNIATAVPMTGDLSIANTGATTLKNNLRTGSCIVTFDGGGQVVQTKIAYVQMPYNGTFGAWSMVADQAGACTITVSKGTFGTFPTSSAVYSVNPAIPATNITATSAGAYNPGMATVTAGDVLKFEISAITAITWVNLSILITKT